MSIRDFLDGFFRALASFQARRCQACGLVHCDGCLCAQIVAEGQRIRAMMRQLDDTTTDQTLLAPWARAIDELARDGRI